MVSRGYHQGRKCFPRVQIRGACRRLVLNLDEWSGMVVAVRLDISKDPSNLGKNNQAKNKHLLADSRLKGGASAPLWHAIARHQCGGKPDPMNVATTSYLYLEAATTFPSEKCFSQGRLGSKADHCHRFDSIRRGHAGPLATMPATIPFRVCGCRTFADQKGSTRNPSSL